MRPRLRLPKLWEATKYVSWPHTHRNPVVRIPRPHQEPESLTVPWQGTEYATLKVCVEYRDKRGPEVWGIMRWRQLMNVPKRSVAKHRKERTGPITGVSHSERILPSGNLSYAWVASWYERDRDGHSRKKSKQFNYGPQARYATSEQAMQAAIELRQEKEQEWYCVV